MATIFKDERDCFTKIRSSLFASVTLAIRTRDLWAERDEPVTILLDDGGELVVHIAPFYVKRGSAGGQGAGPADRGALLEFLRSL